MQLWNKSLEEIDSLTLAADARLTALDYCNDHIWKLQVGRGPVPGLSLSTTFGLRCKHYELFPQFGEDRVAISDPTQFATPPRVDWAAPNFARLLFAPFPQIEVEAEYRVAESWGICGRIRIINRSPIPRRIRIEWIALLNPIEFNFNDGTDLGHRMAAKHTAMTWVLAGKTANLIPLLYLSGGAEVLNVPFPALSLTAELNPGTERDWLWAQAATPSLEESFAQARSLTNRHWDGERGRVEMINAGWIDVQTGIPQWDSAFALSQQIAHGLWMTPPDLSKLRTLNDIDAQQFPNLSFVLSRQPDQGFSRRGDGTDYNHLWNGQSVLDSKLIASLLLPSSPDMIQGLIYNFLVTQSLENGGIDSKPGMVGQRSRFLAPPIIADLVWQIYLKTNDQSFLESCFIPLLRFLQHWFCDFDSDKDCVPEWQQLIQTGFEEHPLYGNSKEWELGASITVSETPSLIAMLYREIKVLLDMEQVLGRSPSTIRTASGTVLPIKEIMHILDEAMQTCWDEQQVCFLNRDKDTHQHPKGLFLGERTGNGEILLDTNFLLAIRPIFHLSTPLGHTQRPKVTITGIDHQGVACQEIISVTRWRWHQQTLYKGGSATCSLAYQRIDRILIEDIGEQDQITIDGLDFSLPDLGSFLALWAGLAQPHQAEAMINQHIDNTQAFLQPYGLPMHTNPVGKLSLLWNIWIIEGLLHYERRDLAADLLQRIMSAITLNLEKKNGFFGNYDVQSGHGSGEINSLRGLAPLGLFLEVLGVTLYSPWKVGLVGFNPFPWPVRIQYRGLNIEREAERTIVTFPDGQVATVTDTQPCELTAVEE